MNECIESNTIGTNAVFNFCLKNKIKLIYSATSASIGNKGKDKNLSPYAFTPVIIALVLYPIPFRTRKSSPAAPMVLCLKTWKSRTSPAKKNL